MKCLIKMSSYFITLYRRELIRDFSIKFSRPAVSSAASERKFIFPNYLLRMVFSTSNFTISLMFELNLTIFDLSYISLVFSLMNGKYLSNNGWLRIYKNVILSSGSSSNILLNKSSISGVQFCINFFFDFCTHLL